MNYKQDISETKTHTTCKFLETWPEWRRKMRKMRRSEVHFNKSGHPLGIHKIALLFSLPHSI